MALAVAIAREMREASFIVSIVLFCELEGERRLADIVH